MNDLPSTPDDINARMKVVAKRISQHRSEADAADPLEKRGAARNRVTEAHRLECLVAPKAICFNCQQVILDVRGRWVHRPDTYQHWTPSCRVASTKVNFDFSNRAGRMYLTWNENVPANWVATPDGAPVRAAMCRFCDQLIDSELGGPWVHRDPGFSIACQDASYVDGAGVNDAMDPRWIATPNHEGAS